MKKILLSIIIVLAATAVKAQYNYLDYGFRASVGLSTLEGNAKMGVSIGAGLFINVDIWDRVGLGLDVLPAIKTGKYEQTGGGTTVVEKYSFFAMDIPLYTYFPFSDNISIEIGKNIVATHLSDKYVLDGKEQEGYSTSEVKGGMLVGLKIQLSSSSELGIRYLTSKITDGGTNLGGGTSGVFRFSFAQDINW